MVAPSYPYSGPFLTPSFHVSTIAALVAYPTTRLAEGTVVHVDVMDDSFRLHLTANIGDLVADGITIIAATDAGGLWERLLIQSYKNQLQIDWYVDSAAGLDTNSGKIGFPLQTTEEVGRRIAPRGTVDFIIQDTNIHLAAGAYTQLTVKINEFVGAYLHVYGAVSSSANITLNSVVNTAPAGPTRGRITTASGTFVDKKRIRCVTGSHVGAMTYSMGLTSATDTFVAPWTDNTYTVVNLTNGDVVVVDTLQSTIAAVDFETGSWDDGGGIWIHDCILSQGGNLTGSSLRDGIFIDGCELGSTTEGGWYGTASFARCRTTTIGGASVKFENGEPRLISCCFQTTTVLHRNVWAQMECGNASNAAGFLIQDGSSMHVQQSTSLDSWEFENGAGVAGAVVLEAGCHLEIGPSMRLWGVTGNYTAGIVVHGGARVVCNTAPTIPSTTNFTLAGNSYAWAAIPVALPRAACSFSLETDSGAPDTLFAGVTRIQGQITSTSTSAQTVIDIDFASLRGINLQNMTATVQVVMTAYQATGAQYSTTFTRVCNVKRITGNITATSDAGGVSIGDGYSSTGITFTSSTSHLQIKITPDDAGSAVVFAVATVTSVALP